ncbi:STAS domain-containing protein [Spartinivicinus ruber]|uniref:STAS domain-containing protein n=1 Tax=Spartinivicinus ruber TaxID=2683272 RepID=UPI0013D47EC8|nr:STAS domain-containing protein [Spartinivicinus ruber]
MNEYNPPKLSTSVSGDNVIIKIGKEFTFQLVHLFREVYTDKQENNYTYIIDLYETEYIDSAALGILLNMKKYLNCSKNKIKLINCNNYIIKLFSLSKFDEAFMVQPKKAVH